MVKRQATKQLGDTTEESSSQRILLEEFRFLQNAYLNNRDQGIVRMNYFITAMSVAIGGVLIFGSNSSNLPINYFKVILLITLLLLAIIGWDLFGYLVQRDISADRYRRGLARIRSYFIKLDPEIKDNFVTSYSDEPTSFITKQGPGILRVSQAIEGFLIGVAITILLTFVQLMPEIAISLGFLAAFLIFLILEIIVSRRFRAALRKVRQNIK